jgi:hypothetical protein
MSAETVDAFRQSILRWCEEEGLTVEQTALEGLDFACQAYFRESPQLRLMVTRATGEAKVVVATAVRFDDAAKARLAALGPGGREAMARDLAWLLSGHPVSYELNRDGATPRSVVIAKPIYDDGLSKTSLMEAISELRRVATRVMLQFDRSVNAQAPNAGTVPPQPAPNVCPNCGSSVKVGAAFCNRCGARLGTR